MIAIAYPRSRPADAAPAMAAAAAAVPVGALLALLLRGEALPLSVVLAGGAGLLGTLVLAVARYDAVVVLGFCLLGVVLVEPAPTDGVFLVAMAVAWAVGGFGQRQVPGPVAAILSLFIVINLLSAVQVLDPLRALSFFAITLYLAALALWLLSYLNSARRARVVLRGYLFAAVTSAALAVAATVGLAPWSNVLLADGARARALFEDPNIFGPFLVPAALIVLEELVAPRLLRVRWSTKAVLLLVLVLGVLFSYSRAAWLNLALGTVVLTGILALRPGGGRRTVALVSLVTAAAAVVAVTIVATGSGDFLAERAQPQAYDQDRFTTQLAGLEAAERYPFGAGPGQFESISTLSAHSTYVRVLAEQGALGLVALLALLLFTAGAALANAVRARDTYGIGSAALVGAWFGLLANSFFIDTLHWRHLWVVAALIWAGLARAGPRPGDP